MSQRIAVVTPAYNEREHVSTLVDTMAAQTLRPSRWMIVDDGSTDGTGACLEERTRGWDWVEVYRAGRSRFRSFASKAAAVNTGFQRLSSLEFEFVACVDADTCLPPDYFAELIRRFDIDPTLGVAGGTYRQQVGSSVEIDRPPAHHVPGPAQVFRRDVFEQIGGYWPLEHGGIDTAANVAARMRGWTTRSYPDLLIVHKRRMGTAGDRGPVVAEYHKGLQDYDLGVLPIWAFLRYARRLATQPYVVGALSRLAGFVTASARSAPRGVDPAFVKHVRAEQRRRLRGALTR